MRRMDLTKNQLKFVLNWDQIPSNVQYKTLNLNKLYWGSVAEGGPLRQSCRLHWAPSETLNRYFWLAPTLDFNSIIINTLLVQQITFIHKENRYAFSKAALSCFQGPIAGASSPKHSWWPDALMNIAHPHLSSDDRYIKAKPRNESCCHEIS